MKIKGICENIQANEHVSMAKKAWRQERSKEERKQADVNDKQQSDELFNQLPPLRGTNSSIAGL